MLFCMRKSKLVDKPDLDAAIIGIVSTLREYKLAWHINQVFGLELEMQPPLQFDLLDRGRLSVVNYLYRTEHSEYRLWRNRAIEENAGFLVKELSSMSYFMIISGVLPMSARAITGSLLGIAGVDFCQLIDRSKLTVSQDIFFV